MSPEQVCHRLTTLQRPGAKGVPFFMIRVDKAGNVSKRFSPGGLHFARFGGACPRWNVHDAFRTPGVIHTQLARMPDGTTWFSIARTVTKTGFGFRNPPQQLAIGLGCDAAHAGQLVYADVFDLERIDAATPIGINCRLCPQVDCSQRAFPPLNHRLAIDVNLREHRTRGLCSREVDCGMASPRLVFLEETCHGIGECRAGAHYEVGSP